MADLLFLIYITIYNGCVCAGLTDYPVEVSRKSTAYFLRLDLNRARDLHFNNKVHTQLQCAFRVFHWQQYSEINGHEPSKETFLLNLSYACKDTHLNIETHSTHISVFLLHISSCWVFHQTCWCAWWPSPGWGSSWRWSRRRACLVTSPDPSSTRWSWSTFSASYSMVQTGWCLR